MTEKVTIGRRNFGALLDRTIGGVRIVTPAQMAEILLTR
jgi:hypothetical protein